MSNETNVTDDARRWRMRLGILMAALLLFRVWYLRVFPCDLVHDEAYYWDWSRQLDWCYYSKPPGVAWLIALATRLGGSTEFFVRLPAAFLSTATLYFVYALGARMYGPKAGFFAALLVALTPGNAAMGVLMTIDAPFLFCWSAALYCFWQMLQRQDDRWKWSILTAVAVGGGLLCKQTMLAFPALAGTFVILSREDRIELRKASFWLCGVGSLLCLLPVILWNRQHGWITLAHTQDHFAAEKATLLDRLMTSLEFLVTQLGLVSPATWLLMASLCLALPITYRRLSRPDCFLIWFSLAPLSGVLALSLKQRVEANWPAAFYIAAFVLVAGAANGVSSFRVSQRRLHYAVAVGLLTVLTTYALPLAVSACGLKGSRIDVVVRMRGWQELGATVGNQLAAVPRPRQTLVLVAAGRAAASELAFYLPTQPQVHLWEPSETISSQYAVWGLPQDCRGWDALIVSEAATLDRDLVACFQDVESLGQVTVNISPQRRHAYWVWRGDGLVDWPVREPSRIAAASRATGPR